MIINKSKMYFLCSLLLTFIWGIFISQPVIASPKPDRPWVQDVIYFAIVDRFLDGDPQNNIPPGCDPGLYDKEKKDIDLYHGGDLAGLMKALENDYFTNLGVTAIWITPPVKNAWWSTPEKKTAYHGYWAQDFLDIDPHLTSSGAGDDCAARQSRMNEYKAFIDLAHKKNIKIIQDIVLNHIGPLFYYDTNNNGNFDKDLIVNNKYVEWIQPYNYDYCYLNAKWAREPQWNFNITRPGKTIEGQDLCLNVKTTGVLQNLDTYGRKGFSDGGLGKTDGEELKCDIYANRDIWTGPNSWFFNELIDEFVAIYRYYLGLGVDGFRVDTVKHVHHVFWDLFLTRIRDRLNENERNKIIIFGEAFFEDAQNIGKYTYKSKSENGSSVLFDSLLNFQFCYAVRSFLRVDKSPYGSPHALIQMIDDLNFGKDDQYNRYYYNREKGDDGFCSKQKMINFIGNHDDLNRFLVNDVREINNRLALGLAITMEGIPCIYYGSESDFRTEGKVGDKNELGRASFLKIASTTSMEDHRLTMDQAAKKDTYQFIKRITDHRKQFKALQYGHQKALYPTLDNNVYPFPVIIFTRYLDDQSTTEKTRHPVIIAVNADPIKTIRINDLILSDIENQPISFNGQKTIQPLSLSEGGSGEASVTLNERGFMEIDLVLPPQSLNMFLVTSNES